MSSNVYLFVISSLNDPIYRKIQTKRRSLLCHYGIPYTVLINHDESKLDDNTESTLVPLNDEEIMYNGGGYNPYMAQKFLMAVKMFFRSFKNYDDIPNYIVRINATVYVHYPSLLKVLNDKSFPRNRVLAGINWGDIFVQGMVMVFSKDVLANMLNDPRMYSKEIMKNNDDVSLSILADPYSKWIDWSKYTCAMRGCATDDKGVYLLEKIKPLENEKWIFRINEPADGRYVDSINWDGLLEYFNEIKFTTPPPQQKKKKPSHKNKWILLFLFLLAVYAIIKLRKRKIDWKSLNKKLKQCYNLF